MVITVGAAFLQNVRSTLQKHLKSVMGTTGATFVRFGFGWPFAWLYLAILVRGFGFELPSPSSTFALWVAVAALAQIAATFLLLQTFSMRNFTVGNAYARTEPMQTAVFAAVLFGAEFSAGAVVAIAVAVAGVMVISVARSPVTPASLVTSVFSRVALTGLASGTLFGLAAVGFQRAARSLDTEFIVQASVTLAVAITVQTLVMLGWMLACDRAEIGRVVRAWRWSLLVGAVGATATFGWFTAFTLQQAALVKVLAQVEMLFAFGSSVLVFGERLNRLEVLGCGLIVGSIVVLVLRS